MSINKDYTYKRKNGGETWCYGNIESDSNFDIVCEDDTFDGIAADIDASVYNTWHKVCSFLEENYNNSVEQIEAC